MEDFKNKLYSAANEAAGFPTRHPKAMPAANDKILPLKEQMRRWTGGGQVNETTSKDYSDKAFVDNKARAQMQGMFKEDQWQFEPNGMLRTEMKSASGGAPYKLSLYPFGLLGALEKMEKGNTDYSALATEIVRGHIAPFCSCPNWIYQNAGPRGENRQLLNPSGSKSDKKNWGLCKHLLFPVKTYPFIQSMYAKRLKDGFFDIEAVRRQYSDGRTKAFLGEGWVMLEKDAMIEASMDQEALMEKWENTPPIKGLKPLILKIGKDLDKAQELADDWQNENGDSKSSIGNLISYVRNGNHWKDIQEIVGGWGQDVNEAENSTPSSFDDSVRKWKKTISDVGGKEFNDNFEVRCRYEAGNMDRFVPNDAWYIEFEREGKLAGLISIFWKTVKGEYPKLYLSVYHVPGKKSYRTLLSPDYDESMFDTAYETPEFEKAVKYVVGA